MARSKKVPLIEDFNSIPEEALVPVEEQPYEIPSHWKWVRLGSVARVVKNKTECFKETRPYVGLEHLAPGGGLVSFGDTTGVKSAKTVFSRGQVLYGRLRPYLDKHWIAEFDGVCSTDILVFNTQPLISRVYFHFWLGTPLFQQNATQNAKGINLPRVSEHVLATFPIPLPPIEEQALIVKKLESNLARIDDVIGRCQTALEDIDDQTNGLLQAAVSGKLTEQWRQNAVEVPNETETPTPLNVDRKFSPKKALPRIEDFDNIPETALVPVEEQPFEIPDSWKWVRLGAASHVNPPKPKMAQYPVDLEISFIPMASVSERSGTVIEIEGRPFEKVSKGYTCFESGDVLFAKITPCMENGKAAIVPLIPHNIGFGSTEFYVIRPSKGITEAQFIHSYLRRIQFRIVAKQAMTGAVGQQRVPKPFMQNYPLPLPPLEEQRAIVERLVLHQEILDTCQQRLEGTLSALENLRFSTVAAAFAGRL